MDNAKTPRIWRLCNSVAVTLRSFGALAPREVWKQLEPSTSFWSLHLLRERFIGGGVFDIWIDLERAIIISDRSRVIV